MDDLLATSTFLHDSCFSILYSAYHSYSDTMLSQDAQLESRVDIPERYPPDAADPHPVHTPISQNWDELLLDAFGVPIGSIPPPGVRPPTLRVDVLRKSRKTANKIDVDTISTSFISRMYSAQLPGHSTPGTELNDGLRQELEKHIINTDTNFITSFLFPPDRSPFPIDDNLLEKFRTRETLPLPVMWDHKWKLVGFPDRCTETAIANWLNGIGEALAKFTGSTIRRVWSHRNCDKAPDGCSIKRKPDIILVDKGYLAKLSSANAPSDWNFIQALCEVTSQQKTTSRITDTINAKSFVMFATQHNRRFVPALSFIGTKGFRLTVTDREGQIRHNETALEGKRHITLFFTILSFLMFGNDADIGLDPNVVVGQDGRVKKIHVDNKCFLVKHLIYSVETLIGRATKVWVVFTSDDTETLYILKDSWIQASYVKSEVSFLKKMSKTLGGRVPELICGGDVNIEGVEDCTGRYRKDLAGYPYSQRVHRRIVTSTIGEPLTKFQSKKEFLNVMISLLKTHKSLCEDLHILHRDISFSNLLLSRPSSKELAVGLLIDFDYAQHLDKDASDEMIVPTGDSSLNVLNTHTSADSSGILIQSSPNFTASTESSSSLIPSLSSSTFKSAGGGPQAASIPDRKDANTGDTVASDIGKGITGNLRTGTPPFMSIESLITKDPNFAQKASHDLESFLYIIIYICTFTNGPGLVLSKEVPASAPLRTWFKKSLPSETGFLKAGHLLRPDISILPYFTGYWEDIKPFVEEMIHTCFCGRPGHPNHLSHDGMGAILQKAFDTVEEPQRTGSKRSHSSDDSRCSKKGKQ